ncbi:MAG TPA: ACP S-malonyltransferase [Chloroflexota bacterium]|nr:ACP S-malonyltransferase [Chloroflexota bacterium]
MFLFPGQGSQRAGMGKDIAEAYPDVAGRTFHTADEVLGLPISRLCFEGPEDMLLRTENTQPALFTTSVALLRVLKHLGLGPQAAAGHSVGEYAALVAAGAIEFEDALPVVRRRGELMANAVEETPGAMAALIGADPEAVADICGEASVSGIVEPSNINAPNQIVVSGEVSAVDRVQEIAKSRGIRAVRLNVSAPFHCRLMEPVRAQLEPSLMALRVLDPEIPVVANATGDYVTTASEIRSALLDQLAAPVLWSRSMERLLRDGYSKFVEVGPGRVLAGLMRALDRRVSVSAAGDQSEIGELMGATE